MPPNPEYVAAMIGFFIAGAALGAGLTIRIVKSRVTGELEQLKAYVSESLAVLRRKAETLDEMHSVTAEAERLLRQYNEENDTDRD